MNMRDVFFERGRQNAMALRAGAAAMTGTEIIDREQDAPFFDPKKDYSAYPAGSPVRDAGQVWLLIQPHNAAHYTGRPADLRALWGLAHTTNPAKAKAWIAPYGTSGMYMEGECYRDDNGTVWRCLEAQTVYPASAAPGYWEEVVMDG